MDDRLVVVHETSNYLDAREFVELKKYDGWEVLVHPFSMRTDDVKTSTGNYRSQEEWVFVLHKF